MGMGCKRQKRGKKVIKDDGCDIEYDFLDENQHKKVANGSWKQQGFFVMCMIAGIIGSVFVKNEQGETNLYIERINGTIELRLDKDFSFQEQIDAAVQYYQPFVIRNQSFAVWNLTQLGPYLTVKQSRSNVFVPHEWTQVAKLARKAGIIGEKKDERIYNISTSDFFDKNRTAWECYEEKMGPMFVAPEYSVNKNVDNQLLWMARKGVRHNLHYDVSHKFIIQMEGIKTVRLTSSNCWRDVNLYPSFHFSARQSQAAYDNVTLNEHTRFVRLYKNDVLYIPPYYFHGSQVEETSVNIHSFSSSQIRGVEKRLLSRHLYSPPELANVLKETPKIFPSALAYLLRSFVHAVKSSVHLNCAVEDEKWPQGGVEDPNVLKALQHLISDMFEKRHTCPTNTHGCPYLEKDLPSNFKGVVNRIAQKTFSLVADLPCQAQVEDIMIANWLEAGTVSNVGFEKACMFLRCLSG